MISKALAIWHLVETAYFVCNQRKNYAKVSKSTYYFLTDAHEGKDPRKRHTSAQKGNQDNLELLKNF